MNIVAQVQCMNIWLIDKVIREYCKLDINTGILLHFAWISNWFCIGL